MSSSKLVPAPDAARSQNTGSWYVKKYKCSKNIISLAYTGSLQGDSFVYPPGWWISRANDFVRSLDLDLKASLQLIVGTSITVFDAGIAAWDMKYAFDSV